MTIAEQAMRQAIKVSHPLVTRSTKKLNFDGRLSIRCKKVGAKVTALARMVKIIPFEKRNY